MLQETYLGKIKMIYIDPPYNTGSDFIYRDDFAKSTVHYVKESNQVDKESNRLVANIESNGRFHSDWLSMMYPRLKLARNVLRDDGVIFISVDDHEQSSLKKLCDEIFGANNFVANIIWQRAYSPVNMNKYFSPNHDFVVCYAKNKNVWRPNLLERDEAAVARYKNLDNDPRGKWKSDNLSVGPPIEKQVYPITTPSRRVVKPPRKAVLLVCKQKKALQELVKG